MYQKFVLGLGILLLVGLGYFITHSDSAGVLSNSFTGNVSTTTPNSFSESVPGTYSCDASSGCENPRTLTLDEDGSAKLVASFANGAEIMEESGTWATGSGHVIIDLTGTNGQNYDVPHKIIVGRVGPDSFSSITFDETVYTDLKNPHFIKQVDL